MATEVNDEREGHNKFSYEAAEVTHLERLAIAMPMVTGMTVTTPLLCCTTLMRMKYLSSLTLMMMRMPMVWKAMMTRSTMPARRWYERPSY